MLKLNHPIEFTEDEKQVITNVMNKRDSNGELLKGRLIWEINNTKEKSLKHRISVHTLREQKCRCAFCERLLEEGGAQIEHIAPKSRHRSFVYEPLNLVTSCVICNSKRIKGDRETIDGVEKPNYADNTFLIVHPYLDDTDSEIVFQDPETRIVFDLDRCTEKGKATIAFFHWDEKDAILSRKREAVTRDVEMDIIDDVLRISTYK